MCVSMKVTDSCHHARSGKPDDGMTQGAVHSWAVLIGEFERVQSRSVPGFG